MSSCFFDELPDDVTDEDPPDLVDSEVSDSEDEHKSGKYRIEMHKSNNQRGLTFPAFFGEKQIAGLSQRVCLTGFPGEFRRKGHGTKVMELIVAKYSRAGSSDLIVRNPTVHGSRFYAKCGFKLMNWGGFGFGSANQGRFRQGDQYTRSWTSN